MVNKFNLDISLPYGNPMKNGLPLDKDFIQIGGKAACSGFTFDLLNTIANQPAVDQYAPNCEFGEQKGGRGKKRTKTKKGKNSKKNKKTRKSRKSKKMKR